MRSGPVGGHIYYNFILHLLNSSFIHSVNALLSDRCPGLTERSRFRCRAGFLMPTHPIGGIWGFLAKNPQNPPKRGILGVPPLKGGVPPKTPPKVLFSRFCAPNTSLRYPSEGKNGKKSVFDIEGFGGVLGVPRGPPKPPKTRGLIG